MQLLIRKGADVNLEDNDGVGIRDCTTDGMLVLLIAFIMPGSQVNSAVGN